MNSKIFIQGVVMNYFKLLVFCLLSSAFTFAMEKPHESSDWAQLVKQQAAIEAAKDFLRQELDIGEEGVLCSQFKGAGFTVKETYYKKLDFTTKQLLQAHRQLMKERLEEARRQLVKEQAKILKASQKRPYTEI